jgi:hypothetical protein
MSAEKSAGVRDGMQAFAFGTSETPPNGPGKEETGVQNALNFPGTIAAREIQRACRVDGKPSSSGCRAELFPWN